MKLQGFKGAKDLITTAETARILTPEEIAKSGEGLTERIKELEKLEREELISTQQYAEEDLLIDLRKKVDRLEVAAKLDPKREGELLQVEDELRAQEKVVRAFKLRIDDQDNARRAAERAEITGIIPQQPTIPAESAALEEPTVTVEAATLEPELLTVPTPTAEAIPMPVSVPEADTKSTPEPLAASIPTAKEPVVPQKRVFEAGVIDVNALVESQARDIADHRMSESAEDRSVNFFVRMKRRIWDHNLAAEYNRQKEIQKAKQEIYESKNLYAGEKADEDPDAIAHRNAMVTITERFTRGVDPTMDEDLLTEEERESKKGFASIGMRDQFEYDKARAEIKDLVRTYAGSEMDAAAFEEQKKRILSRVQPDSAKENTLYGDNLLSIAQEVKKAIESGEMAADMDFDVNLTLGKARESLRSEASKSGFDACVERLQNLKLGRFLVNEPVALGVAAGLFSGAQWAGLAAARSAASTILPFVGGTVLSGLVTGAKESARVSRERIQDAREGAKGSSREGKRREEFESSRYETEPAQSYIDTLNGHLKAIREGSLQPEALAPIMKDLASVEARIRVGDARNIDLITYSGFDTVETERAALVVVRAELKVALRKTVGQEHFDDLLKELEQETRHDVWRLENGTESVDGTNRTEGIDEKDEKFKAMKRGRVVKAALKSMAISATLGIGVQEIRAAIDPNVDGIVGGVIDHFKDHPTPIAPKATILEDWDRRIFGHASGETSIAAGPMTTASFEDATLKLPDGMTMAESETGTYTFMQGGQPIAENLRLSLDSNGAFTPESIQTLHASEMFATPSALVTTTESIPTTVTAAEYVTNHHADTIKIHRDLWYDNNTPHPFDKNELRAWYGGPHNTGINGDGNYVFTMQHMTPDGSYHEGASADAQELMREGKLKMLFSLSGDTQHQVFEVPVNEQGEAIIAKDSPVAKLMFKNVGGHAMFTGKFAEVAHATGTAADGGQNMRILSTLPGEGHATVEDVIAKPVVKPVITIGAPLSYGGSPSYETVNPFPIPAIPRRAIEQAESRRGLQRAANDNTAPVAATNATATAA